MKNIVDFINESQENSEVKNLFNQIDKYLQEQEFDKVASIIEEIFKNKWGKAIKLDNVSDELRKNSNNILLGFNKKTNSWTMIFWNNPSHAIKGAIFDSSDNKCYKISGPMYWSNVRGMIEDMKLKLKYGESKEFDSTLRYNILSDFKYDF